MNVDYSKMTLDELMAEYRPAAQDDDVGPGQQSAVGRIDALVKEINSRDGAMQRYRALLSDESSFVRYSAALSVQWEDADTAYAVFKELVASSPSVRLQARIAVYELEDSGRLKA